MHLQTRDKGDFGQLSARIGPELLRERNKTPLSGSAQRETVRLAFLFRAAEFPACGYRSSRQNRSAVFEFS